MCFEPRLWGSPVAYLIVNQDSNYIGTGFVLQDNGIKEKEIGYEKSNTDNRWDPEPGNNRVRKNDNQICRN
ncbi:hypothetical protein TRIP_C21672 [Candidatus Zixiibacteriota bacterium]|nr:hypothetical protein TRIP_C21672 [candidate division Zixibacteria bacterium]